MRLLLAAASALLVLGLAGGGFVLLLGSYDRHHREAAAAEVTVDASGQIRIDGQAISLEAFRAAWQQQAFRAEHCGRWGLTVHPNLPKGLERMLSDIINCR